MSEVWIKLRLLWLYRHWFREWKADVWDKEGRARMCCDGYQCACRGSCNIDWWEHLLGIRRDKP